MLSPLEAVVVVLVGYALGAMPVGTIVARVYRNVDLTKTGSGRTGATNVLRTLGPGAAAIVFAGDFLKGVAAVLVAGWLSQGNTWAEMLAAVASVVGHSYSPFVGFKGGRGVTTGLGATFVAAPVLMLIAVASGGVLIWLTRYVSLGSLVGATVGGALMVVAGVATGDPALAVWGAAIAGFIVVAHRDNIERLRKGTERKLGERARMA